jgi:FHS family glucose/mannose:H+ symporter-like MFS transporter
MRRSASKFEIVLLYGTGVVQGLALVTFPAASAVFTSADGFALSGTQYGAMFIPQVAMAIFAATFGSRLSQHLGLRGVLRFGLGGNFVAMSLLSASALVTDSPVGFLMLCAATGSLGFGFGASVMALNTLVEGFLPQRADAAVLALNAMLGLGTALAPLLVSLFTRIGAWWALPLATGFLLAALLVATLLVPLALDSPTASSREKMPPRFWLYAGAVLLYGIAETLAGNWASLYLSIERQVSAAGAAMALTAFWVAVTLGRIGSALLARVVSARYIYLALPVALAIAFQLVARSQSAGMGIATFALVGLACSAFLPLCISFSGAEFPRRSASMSGDLIAFYQVGYGLAAFGAGALVDRYEITYSAVFSACSLVAVALAGIAFLIAGKGTPGKLVSAEIG